MDYDSPKMEGLWPSEEECPGFKYASDAMLSMTTHMCGNLHGLDATYHATARLTLPPHLHLLCVSYHVVSLVAAQQSCSQRKHTLLDAETLC